MITVTIRDIPVHFPFTPYDIQTTYMTKVIECLDNKQNGILESPTGTGKTLSLLCATLAWLENRKKQGSDENPPPRVIYASRTHTQIQQAMQEMKRTAYNYMKACVLGSREHMCINEEVMSERNSALKVRSCLTKVKRNKCTYYSKVERTNSIPCFSQMNIMDMEDLVKLGRLNCVCPYYAAREFKKEADVVFMPYNYLLDPRTLKSMGLQCQDDIIIFDEGHNIEKVCEDSVSVQITTTDVQSAIDDVNAIIDLVTKETHLDVEELHFTPQQLITFNKMLISLKNGINEIELVPLALEGTVFDGDHIFTILEEAGISEKNFFGVNTLLDGIMDFVASTKLFQRSARGLQIIGDLLFIVFYRLDPEFREKIKESFKVQVDDAQTTSFTQTSETCRVLNFWCFCPAFGMKMLLDQNIHCVILTSGTLAPLKPLISELELDVGVHLENPHVIHKDQICVKILSNGPDMQPLNSNFQNRNNPKYIQSLGLVISNLIRVIPDGVLIFFPSYAVMEQAIQKWKRSGFWDTINRAKPVYIEPKDKISFNNAMEGYYSKIQDPSYKGAIFIGVCRGKISEGLDFADINGRAVLITGLPYPPLKDPKIILKKRYLDFRHSKDKEYLKGDDWYSLEATRAINQAIGRVIRHKNDYGAIILLDSRFTNPRVKTNLSLWLRQHITDVKNFGEIVRTVRIFFQTAKEKLPQVPESAIAIEELTETSDNSLVEKEDMGSPPKKMR